jgi:hypothetical protein
MMITTRRVKRLTGPVVKVSRESRELNIRPRSIPHTPHTILRVMGKFKVRGEPIFV